MPHVDIDRWEVASTHPVQLLHHWRVRTWGCRQAWRKCMARTKHPTARQGRWWWEADRAKGLGESAQRWVRQPIQWDFTLWVKAEEKLHYLAHDNSKPSRWKSAVKSSLAWRSALEQVSFSAMQHEPQADQQGNHPVTVAKNTLEQKPFQGRPELLEHPLPFRPFQSL